jgi:hypothetical protein
MLHNTSRVIAIHPSRWNFAHQDSIEVIPHHYFQSRHPILHGHNHHNFAQCIYSTFPSLSIVLDS